jgi:hypothetical protein
MRQKQFRQQQRQNDFSSCFKGSKETPVTVSIDKEGKLGVGLGGLSITNLEKLGYYKVSKLEFGFMVNSGRSH